MINQLDREKFKNIAITREDRDSNMKFREMISQERNKRKGNDHFYQNTILYQKEFTKSQLFSVVRAMPKGVLHHLHISIAHDRKWVNKVS